MSVMRRTGGSRAVGRINKYCRLCSCVLNRSVCLQRRDVHHAGAWVGVHAGVWVRLVPPRLGSQTSPAPVAPWDGPGDVCWLPLLRATLPQRGVVAHVGVPGDVWLGWLLAPWRQEAGGHADDPGGAWVRRRSHPEEVEHADGQDDVWTPRPLPRLGAVARADDPDGAWMPPRSSLCPQPGVGRWHDRHAVAQCWRHGRDGSVAAAEVATTAAVGSRRRCGTSRRPRCRARPRRSSPPR
mmetsp:Transcript_9582/g.29538  ORF Transcript_9582/g.29538 Transcript_9582/m.29538 type:complete len:239 (+) Transcript_9582:70-786(+)